MTAPPRDAEIMPNVANAQSMTDPNAAVGPAAAPAMNYAPAVQSGIATRYWDELVAYPAGSQASLWLLVDGGWRAHDNPAPWVRDAVQRAFIGSGQSVRVWYDGTAIHGLVVNN